MPQAPDTIETHLPDGRPAGARRGEARDGHCGDHHTAMRSGPQPWKQEYTESDQCTGLAADHGTGMRYEDLDRGTADSVTYRTVFFQIIVRRSART